MTDYTKEDVTVTKTYRFYMGGGKEIVEIDATSYWEAINELRFQTDRVIDMYEARNANDEVR